MWYSTTAYEGTNTKRYKLFVPSINTTKTCVNCLWIKLIAMCVYWWELLTTSLIIHFPSITPASIHIVWYNSYERLNFNYPQQVTCVCVCLFINVCQYIPVLYVYLCMCEWMFYIQTHMLSHIIQRAVGACVSVGDLMWTHDSIKTQQSSELINETNLPTQSLTIRLVCTGNWRGRYLSSGCVIWYARHRQKKQSNVLGYFQQWNILKLARISSLFICSVGILRNRHYILCFI